MKELKIFLTVYLVYLMFISNYGGNFMADSMLSATISIVEKGTFIIDDYVTETCKKTGCDHAIFNGHYYSGFAPGLTFMSLPVYFFAYPFLEKFLPDTLFNNPKTELKLIALNILATIFISSLLSALSCVLIYKISSFFTKNEKNMLFTTFALAFCTVFFLYSTGYYTRSMASFFSLFAFYKLIKIKNNPEEKNNCQLFCAGVLGSIAVSIDYPHFIILTILFFYLLSFLRNKKIIYFIIGASLIISLILLYHYSIFGSPFTTPFQHRASILEQKYFDIGFGGFDFLHPDKLLTYSFSPKRGLFFYNPIFLLSFLGLYIGFKKYKSEMLVIFSIWLFTFLLYSSSAWPWWIDGSFGPRYLVAAMPYLILPLNFIIDKISKFRISIFLIPSFFITLLGAMYDRTGFWSYPFDVNNPIFSIYIPLFLNRGFTNYSLNIITYKLISFPAYALNIIFFMEILFLIFIIKFIWRKTETVSISGKEL